MTHIITLHDYLRPWKLFSLACGIGILLVGSVVEQAMDWDFPISFIMAISTYIFAPITARTLFYAHFRKNWQQNWKWWVIAIFGLWLSVDGVYWAYWTLKDPAVVEAMRSANFPASFCLYMLCGFIWLYDGSLKQLWQTVVRK